jgi:hypothetical protein
MYRNGRDKANGNDQQIKAHRGAGAHDGAHNGAHAA